MGEFYTLGWRRKRKDYLKERIRESAVYEKEEKGLFKRKNKGEC